MDKDMEAMQLLIRKNIETNYKVSLTSRIEDVTSSIMGFVLVLFLIPFLTLINIFELIFIRKSGGKRK